MIKLQLFTCTDCHYEGEEFADVKIGEFISSPCPVCGSRLQRKVSFSFHRSMPAHYNAAVGQFVGGKHDFRDALKRKSEEQTLRTGIEHNYEPVDLKDKDACGATDEGLYETEKRQRDSGQVASKKKIVT